MAMLTALTIRQYQFLSNLLHACGSYTKEQTVYVPVRRTLDRRESVPLHCVSCSAIDDDDLKTKVAAFQLGESMAFFLCRCIVILCICEIMQGCITKTIVQTSCVTILYI